MDCHLWPYSNLHGLNLDWILDVVKKYSCKVEQLSAEVASWNQKLQAMDAAHRKLISDTDKANRQWTLQQLNQAVLNLEAEITNYVSLLRQAIQNGDNQVKAWVSVELQKMYNLLPTYTNIKVVNPISGMQDTLQHTLDDLYYFLRYGGITCSQYLRAGLTCDEYKSLNMSCTTYALYSKWIIWKRKKPLNQKVYMPDPWSGEWKPVTYVVTELAALHREEGPTVDEYNAFDLTCNEYTAKNISAYEYAWNGKVLLGGN